MLLQGSPGRPQRQVLMQLHLWSETKPSSVVRAAAIVGPGGLGCQGGSGMRWPGSLPRPKRFLGRAGSVEQEGQSGT